ncbi:MAG: hypothetical protein M3O03_10545 [Pseudomonadota bacterium]|nr:hypothetical protein [Pseudomonadota bacterium]
MNDKTVLERAFDLARSGICLNVRDLINRLKIEGYTIEQIQGPSLNKQLKELIERAKKPVT